MALFANRKLELASRVGFYEQDKPDGDVVQKELQKQILTIDQTIDSINRSIQFHKNLVKLDGQSIASEILRLRIMQKLGDVKSVILQFEDPQININYLDALQSVQDKVKTREVFMSLPQVFVPTQAPGATGIMPELGE